ncbi:MAG: hypothetical protein QGG36_24485 [Pirellulaceae bacterium]|jgi:hypothetical protein|nr:hypothetical protein [Pirellulaceae bacterium]MDP7018977.1 hypothetical protein [Pirellulaceae bacterium]
MSTEAPQPPPTTTDDSTWAPVFLFLLVTVLGIGCFALGVAFFFLASGFDSYLYGVSLIAIFSTGFFYLAVRAIRRGVRTDWWK